MTDKELKNWIFAWAKDVKGTPIDSEINDLIYMVDACLAPKMKRVDLDEMKKPMSTGSVAFKSNETSAVFTNAIDNVYNRSIDDIKAKYGDLYVEVKE